MESMMPFKFETEKKKIPIVLKKSAKLLPEDKEEMRRLYKLGGWSYRTLGIEFGVSKSMAIFAVNPERQERSYRLRVERGGSKQYYDKDKQTKAMREHRQYKKKLDDEGLLKK